MQAIPEYQAEFVIFSAPPNFLGPYVIDVDFQDCTTSSIRRG